MPTYGYSKKPSELNAKLWYNCVAVIKQNMLNSGWVENAKKFSEVQSKKANKLFNDLYYKKASKVLV